MKVTCDVILDLLPLVKEGVASQASQELVHQHIKMCGDCRTEFEDYTACVDGTPDDDKVLSYIRRNIFAMGLVLLILGALMGVALSNSFGIFYNFIIMPMVGVFSLTLLKDQWFYSLPGIFILSYLWLLIGNMVNQGLSLGAFYSPLFLSGIYTILVALGGLITKLIKFALKGEV